jgi:hypothetical protein
MDDLPKLWESIKADLRRARNLLPNCSEDQHSLSRYYEEFLEHNELELACDAFEDSAKGRAVSGEFWLALRDAAKKMRLDEHAARFEKRAALNGSD